MNQEYYRYIYQIHRKQLDLSYLQRELTKSPSNNASMRKRVLLFMSDLLLSLGQRIRPSEFQVHVHGEQAHDGTLEIKTEGC